jgi:GT2 family glycosyltransferase
MNLSIIIVSWNIKDLLAKCLNSIYRHSQGLNFEIFVVDNHSTDGSSVMLKKEFTQVKLIQNNENLGFARANNQAIRQAQGRYILLLNPDTELIDDSLSKLIEFMNKHKQCAILGPKLLHPDKSVQASVRRLPKFSDQFFILLKLHNLFPSFAPIKKYYMLGFDYHTTSQVEQVMGAAMLIRRAVFEKIGLLDEKFWLIFEEVDFCKRAAEAGFKIYFYPGAQVIHHKGKSFAQHKSLARQMNFNRNLFYYFKKHGTFYQLVGLWLLQPISLLLALIDQLLKVKKLVGKNRDL